VKVPIVIRLVGTNEEEGRQILKATNFITADTLVHAAELAVKAAKEN
jgi:succinyl-CoA synthetase beta subunit